LHKSSPSDPASVRNPHQVVEDRLNLLRQTRCSEIARLLGKSHATISRDRGSLSQWRADELLTIAAHDPELCQALSLALTGENPAARQFDPFVSVVEELSQMASLSQTISGAIADQRIDAKEAEAILHDVYRMVSFLNGTLIPSLERMRDHR
jgi:hypothetical protein